MAVVITQAVASIASTSQAATYAFGSFTPTAGSILVCIAGATGNTNQASITNTSGTALVWNAIPLTNRLYNVGSIDSLSLLWAVVPAGPAASVYTLAGFTGNATGCCGLLLSAAGAAINAINPIRQFTSTVRTTTAANAVVTFGQACDTTSGVIAAWFGQLAAASSAAPTNFTELNDVAYTTPAANGSSAHRSTGETGTTFTFTNATTIWGSVGVEIYDAALGPQSPAYTGGGYYGY